MFQSFKNFVNENKGVIYTVGLLILLDHFLLKGVFRARLQNIIHNFLEKAECAVKDGIKEVK